MRNENPAENRYEFPPGLASRKVKFEGKIGREDEFYDKRVFQIVNFCRKYDFKTVKFCEIREIKVHSCENFIVTSQKVSK